MNWSSERFLRKTYEGSGRHTKDLDDIRVNWSSERFFRKTYEGSGRHTNELGFRKILEEDIRMNWTTYE